MYAAPFDYRLAGSWAEAVDLLGRHGDDARVLAGGQSLVPMMTLRLASPATLIDVNGVESDAIRVIDDRVEVPALTRHAEIERSPVLAAACPLLPEAATLIGNVRVRHRGTIGGSLAHADPAAELACAAVAVGAEVVILGPDGSRREPVASFLQGYYTTSLRPREVVVSARFPVFGPGRGSAFLELARRVGDFASVTAAATVDLDRDDVCTGARLVVGAVADRPVDLSDGLGSLVGGRLDQEAVTDAVTEAAGGLRARDDERASGGYRRDMVRVLGVRALLRAAGRARGDE